MKHSISVDTAREIERTLVLAGHHDLAALLKMRPQQTPEETQYAELARCLADEGLNFDDNPVVSISEEGAFVSAWVWIPAPDKSSVAA